MEETISQINEVLYLMDSNVKAMTEEIDSFDIIAMFKEIHESFFVLMDKRELSLAADIPETLVVYMNKVIARLIIHNLLSNAVNYANTDSEISMSIYVEKEQLYIICENEATSKNIERMYKNETLFNAVVDKDAQADNEAYVYSAGNGMYLIKELAYIAAGTYKLSHKAHLVHIQVELPVTKSK